MRTPEQNGDHQREALTGRKERRRGEGRRVARRPMFRAEQRTDGDRQRRRVPRLHAVTIQQTAAGAGRGQPKPAEIVKSEAESGRNERELAKIVTFVYILGQYGKESPRRRAYFLQNPAEMDGTGTR